MLQFAGYNMITSGKKIKISLEHSGKVVNIECEQYKPIKYLKERAGKIFYPLNSDSKLVYNNKDLTQYESVALGDFFKNKTSIHIKVFQIVNFNAKEQNVNYASLSNSPNVNYKSFGGNVALCSCGNDPISYYCRTDKTFICKSCRLNKSHKNHIVNFFDVENIEESLRFYIKTIQSEITQTVKSCRKYSENSKNSKLLDPQSRKEMILRKLDEIEKRQQDILKSLPYVENSSIFIEEVEEKSNSCFSDLDTLTESIHKVFQQDKNSGFNKTSSFYDLISDVENEVNKINETVVNYKVNFEVHRKFDDMYKMIEKALDAVYHVDYSIENLIDESTQASYEKIANLRNPQSPSRKNYNSGSSVEKGSSSERDNSSKKIKKGASLSSDDFYNEVDSNKEKKVSDKNIESKSKEKKEINKEGKDDKSNSIKDEKKKDDKVNNDSQKLNNNETKSQDNTKSDKSAEDIKKDDKTIKESKMTDKDNSKTGEIKKDDVKKVETKKDDKSAQDVKKSDTKDENKRDDKSSTKDNKNIQDSKKLETKDDKSPQDAKKAETKEDKKKDDKSPQDAKKTETKDDKKKDDKSPQDAKKTETKDENKKDDKSPQDAKKTETKDDKSPKDAKNK